MSLNKIFLILSISLLLGGVGNNAFAQFDDKLVVLETSLGDIVIEFFPSDAPNHVDNFIGLTESKFYDGVLFHRIIPGFMIQGGDPYTISGDSSVWGVGGPDTNVDAEFNTIKHNRGIVSMARSADPNSGGSQFFIVHADANFLDGQYTVFGRIVTEESFETLDKIASVDTVSNDKPLDPESARITKATVVNRSEISNLLELKEPQRTRDSVPTVIGNQKYESAKHQIRFSVPEGWLLQELEKTSSESPDVVAVGPKTGTVNPNISLIIQSAGQTTFDDLISQKIKKLDGLAESDNLEIISQEKTTINENKAYVTIAEGIFSSNGTDLNVKFKEVMIYDNKKTYTLLYANGIDEFDLELLRFEESVNSFEILSQNVPLDNKDYIDFGVEQKQLQQKQQQEEGGDGKEAEQKQQQEEGGGCLIATATFGSELAPQVQQLRELRDSTVLSTKVGTLFMSGFNQFYYSFSPVIADLERENPVFKEMVKISITPLLSSLSILNHVEIDSEEEMLSYGIGIILMNIGMYFIAPAVVIYKIRK